MNRKDIAKEFLQLAGMGHVKEAFDNLVSKDFIHHNQYFEGTREALQNAMSDAHLTDPNKSIEVKNIFEENNIIITHSLVHKATMDIAVVHIFKFNADHKITELWDLGQVIEKDSPNKNGLF
ncbi:nuclear transport factor 2 family protein [Winogradskyella sp.]|uniref:nuclear transport factor 2 family protein n=1 Tax=Winogradskyella sp. TaxID=1883156 RepID=UPI00261F34F7|nr:nuclear transport factor 2 family protein [Winogradskyella sp.]